MQTVLWLPLWIPKGLPAQMIGASSFLLTLCWGWTSIPGHTWSGFLQPLAAQPESVCSEYSQDTSLGKDGSRPVWRPQGRDQFRQSRLEA